MSDGALLGPVEGEGRWVVMTERVLERFLAAVREAEHVELEVTWGAPETRLVTFSTPTLRVKEPVL